jgi:hypothetical protein
MADWKKYMTWIQSPNELTVLKATNDIDFHCRFPRVVCSLWALVYRVKISPEQKPTLTIPQWKALLKSVCSAETPRPPSSYDLILSCDLEWAWRYFRWALYLEPWINAVIPPGPVATPVKATAVLLEKQIKDFLSKTNLDSFYDMGIDFARSSFLLLGAKAAYAEKYPDQEIFASHTEYLNEDLTLEEKVLVNQQRQLMPQFPQEWAKMLPQVQEMWAMAAWTYRFNQEANKGDCPQLWQSHFWLPWWEWGTEEGDTKLKTKQVYHMAARPLVLMIRSGHWMVRKRSTLYLMEDEATLDHEEIPSPREAAQMLDTGRYPGEVVETTNLFEALAQWLEWVQKDYENCLENGTPCPLPFRFSDL